MGIERQAWVRSHGSLWTMLTVQDFTLSLLFHATLYYCKRDTSQKPMRTRLQCLQLCNNQGELPMEEEQPVVLTKDITNVKNTSHLYESVVNSSTYNITSLLIYRLLSLNYVATP